MNHLLRELAPIGPAGWKQIDDEARERLNPHLAARRIVDLSGPHGWAHSAVGHGRVRPLSGAPDGVLARQRQVLALAEVRVPFDVSRAELDNAERGAEDLELDDLDRAARQIALVENRAVFHGWAEAGITGITQGTPYAVEPFGEDPTAFPHTLARAVETLRRKGIGGPYALAVSPDGYHRIVESSEGGVLLLDHLKRVLGDGKVVRSPGLDGALVLSLAGGDFSLELGLDLSVGYSRHDAESVTLYLEESFTFRVTGPDAAVALS